MPARLLRIALLLVALMTAGDSVWAHEVDQYSLPGNREFVDLGPFWDRLLFHAVAGAVDRTNREIRTAEGLPVPLLKDAALRHLQSPETLTWRVRRNLPSAFGVIEHLEMEMRLLGRKDARTGRLLSHRPSLGVYGHVPVWPDPRQINRIVFMRSSMIKVHDHYFGTDKVGHFISMGFLYYQVYQASMLAGSSDEDALRYAVNSCKWGPLSEGALLGFLPTGIYSNADMAANYTGMKYYINVTRPVRLHGQQHPPMVVRHGPYWQVQPHVSDRSGYFGNFVSVHYDEVLNPSLWEPGMRSQVRQAASQHRQQLLDWYTAGHPDRQNRAYFDQILAECRTYFGEPYGYVGTDEQLVTMGQLCFDLEPVATSGVLDARRCPPGLQRTGASYAVRPPQAARAAAESVGHAPAPVRTVAMTGQDRLRQPERFRIADQPRDRADW